MDQPRLAAGRQASILFDYRRSAGPLEAERTFAEVIGSSRSTTRLRRMASGRSRHDRRDVDGQLSTSARRPDSDRDLARSYALESGVTGLDPDRHDLAMNHGRIDEETGQD
jgi:hypothetical protein